MQPDNLRDENASTNESTSPIEIESSIYITPEMYEKLLNENKMLKSQNDELFIYNDRLLNDNDRLLIENNRYQQNILRFEALLDDKDKNINALQAVCKQLSEVFKSLVSGGAQNPEIGNAAVTAAAGGNDVAGNVNTMQTQNLESSPAALRPTTPLDNESASTQEKKQSTDFGEEFVAVNRRRAITFGDNVSATVEATLVHASSNQREDPSPTMLPDPFTQRTAFSATRNNKSCSIS